MNSRRLSIRAAALVLVLTLVGAVLVPALSLAETPDYANQFVDATELPASFAGTATINPAADDADDIVKVNLTAGKRFEVLIEGATAGVDVDVFIYSASDTSNALAYTAKVGSNESVTYDVRKAGWYYVDINAYDGRVAGTTASTAGDYAFRFKQYAVPYKLQSFKVPSSARKNKKFSISVLTNPTYVRDYKPVTFVAQKKSGSAWKNTIRHAPKGYAIAGEKTEYAATATLSKGTWRIRAEFKDTDHALKKTAWKTVKIK